jgi:hypothetical protein
MASDKATSPLMNLPLEVRHNIFEYAAVRDTKPKKLLRYWFEKKDVEELVAKEVAANPSGPAPRVVYHQEHEIDSDTPEEEDVSDEEGAADEDEDQGEDGEDNEYADDDDNANDEDEDDEEEHEQEDQEVEHDAGNDDEPTPGQNTSQASTTATQGTSLAAQASTTTQTQTQLAIAADDAEEDDANTNTQDGETVTEDPHNAAGDEVMAEVEGEEGENDEDAEEGADVDEDGNTNDTATAPQQPPPPPAPILSPARKWRHVPNFMRITHCPPPVELLLASKQLNEEAKNWFYDVAVLKVNATGSFAHTSFFEETFRQITDAAFSPMENVRKVAVLFAWDTTWLRADDTGCAEAIFPALLRQRSVFVYQILSQAPDLKEVTIHWHDSAQDNESANFMLDILAPFHSLNVHLTIKEHYIATDVKPHKRSIAGQRRVEFQSIMDAGLDRLF